LDITYSAITYPALVRTSFLARRPANTLLTTDRMVRTNRPVQHNVGGQSVKSNTRRRSIPECANV